LPQFQILLVDDLQSEAQIFGTALEEASVRARVYWVATGSEAMDFLNQRGRFEDVGTVKIVILDLHLEEEDGFSILREMKASPQLSRKPVIMLSSSTNQSEIDLAYSLGANAFFRKPVSLASYIDLVQVLSKHWLDLAQLPSCGRAFAQSSEKTEHVGRELPEDPLE
jgi:CheY-like chemotaxis protein